MIQITLVILGLIVTAILITILVLNPIITINFFKIKNFKFRVHKKKLNNYYYLQMRVCGIWYFIDKWSDDYILDINSSNKSIKYASHNLLEAKRNIIYDHRWEILKYFADTGSPDDIQNI